MHVVSIFWSYYYVLEPAIYTESAQNLFFCGAIYSCVHTILIAGNAALPRKNAFLIPPQSPPPLQPPYQRQKQQLYQPMHPLCTLLAVDDNAPVGADTTSRVVRLENLMLIWRFLKGVHSWS